MHTDIDHLVWAGPDLDALVTRATSTLGVAPQEGGPHEGLGTKNFLLGLDASRYLELIGPDPDQSRPARARPFGIDVLQAPALVSWAARTPDMTTALPEIRSRGYDPGERRDMSRRRPDGTLLSWTLTQPGGQMDGVAPFLIDWHDTTHPTVGLPEVELASFVLSHPEATRVERILDAIELRERQTVQVESTAAPSLQAEVRTSAGVVTIG